MKPARIIVICIAAVSAIGLALVVRAMGSPSGEPTAVATAAGTLGSTRGPLDADRQATRERAALCIVTTAARL
jgi:hypothetical protein